jgi:hypothetical protein
LGKTADSLDHAARPFDVAEDFSNDTDDLGKVRIGARELTETARGIYRDGSERLVQLMCDRSTNLAKRCDAVGMT